MNRKTALALTALLVLSGCANLSSVHRTLDTTNGQGVLIDIKQRAILASVAKGDGENGTGPYSITCAEPSPDALSAYAFDLAAKGSLPTGKSLSTAFGGAESASFVGLRSQSIQLLRDQFFRACEAYMNRAINADQYDLLIRRYQKQTAALLAIEQLTGVVTAPAAVVSAAGSAQGSAAAALHEVYKDNKVTIAALKKALAEPNATDDQKKSAQAEIDQLEKENKELVQSMKTAAAESVSMNASGSTGHTAPASNAAKADFSSIAGTVQHIVDNITQTDDFLQLCIAKFAKAETARTPTMLHASQNAAVPQSMREACMVRMGIANDELRLVKDQLRLKNEITEKYVGLLLSDTKLSQSERRSQLDDVLRTFTNYQPSPMAMIKKPSINLAGTRTMNTTFVDENGKPIVLNFGNLFSDPPCDPKKDKKCK